MSGMNSNLCKTRIFNSLIVLSLSIFSGSAIAMDTCSGIKTAIQNCSEYQCMIFEDISKEQKDQRNSQIAQATSGGGGGMNQLMGMMQGAPSEMGIMINVRGRNMNSCIVEATVREMGKKEIIRCELKAKTISDWAQSFQTGDKFKLKSDPILSTDCQSEATDTTKQFQGGGSGPNGMSPEALMMQQMNPMQSGQGSIGRGGSAGGTPIQRQPQEPEPNYDYYEPIEIQQEEGSSYDWYE